MAPQVTVAPSGAHRTQLRFHSEWLADADEWPGKREYRRQVKTWAIEALNRTG